MRKPMSLAIMMMMVWTHVSLVMAAGNVIVDTDDNGSVAMIRLAGDTTNMNWILTQGANRQYAWLDGKYAWGNGRVVIDGAECFWQMRGGEARCGSLRISVDHGPASGGDYAEEYVFSNEGNNALRLSEIGIFTPFNDNYPDAFTCVTRRCNAHVWAGGSAAYVCALRMGGQGPHLGLMLTEGSICHYEVFERGAERGASNFRGVLALCPPDTTLQPGQTMRLAWRLFAHDGKDDFEQQMLMRGGAVVTANRYVGEVGQQIDVSVRTLGGTTSHTLTLDQLGDKRHQVNYGHGKTTFVETFAITPVDTLLARRADFILSHQQMLDTTDVRYGAFMVYDNEGDSLLTSYTRSDLDEGRERVGMGVFLASHCLLHRNAKTEVALDRYATYIRTKLQDAHYRTKSSLVKQSKNRGYNYAWVAWLYFKMYQLTGCADYARHGYGTIKALYRYFGDGFYCIGYPVIDGLEALANAGMAAERDTLLAMFKRTGDVFVSNGLRLPKFEVNYEQSIVAPAVQFLCEL